MAAATERLPVLVTKAQKSTIARKAKRARLTMGEFVRRAAEAYDPSAEDAALLAGLAEQIRKTTDEAVAALDRALEAVARSEQRIAEMEAAHAGRGAGQ